MENKTKQSLLEASGEPGDPQEATSSQGSE